MLSHNDEIAPHKYAILVFYQALFHYVFSLYALRNYVTGLLIL